jgi:hypothetical protein
LFSAEKRSSFDEKVSLCPRLCCSPNLDKHRRICLAFIQAFLFAVPLVSSSISWIPSRNQVVQAGYWQSGR